MKHTYTIFRTSVILLLAASFGSANAQRILPYFNGVTGGQGLISAMVEYDGQLVMGGTFDTFNGHARKDLQGWDGTTHFDYPGAFDTANTRVRAMVVFDGDLVVAGTEPGFGNVARWDGSSWHPFGAGPLGLWVTELCVFDGELYVLTQGSAVQKWDGTNWVVVGEIFSGAVKALATFNGELYAGGQFTQNAANVELRRLAKWNGSAWEEVNNGLNSIVSHLLATPEGLVIGGGFTTRGDGQQVFPRWTVYDGNTFSEPTTGVGPTGSDLVTYISTIGDTGYLLGGSAASSLWVSGSGYRELAFRTSGCAIVYDGITLLGGYSNASCTRTVGVCRLMYDGTYQAWLDEGNVRAAVVPGTNMFYDVQHAGAGFEVPKGDSTHSIYAASPWMVGERSGGAYTDFPMYNTLDTSGIVAVGPHATEMDEAFVERYCQVWKLDQVTISEHAQHWNDPDYVAPYAITSWPGNGNTANGEPAQLAPYADANGNGVYEPQAGEFPLIRGDQAVYSILHSSTGMDLGVMHYAFADSTDADRYNTVFTNMTIVNRGQEAFENARFGMYTEFTLGDQDDNYVGCDSLLGLWYVYNGDSLDEDSDNQLGYGTNIPAQGALFLNQPMTAHAYVQTSGDGALWAINGTMWNGQPFNQTGYPSHFQYPGGQFTEVEAGNMPGWRPTVGSIGPLTINSGDTLCVDMAFPFARAASGDRLESIDALLARAQALHAWYDAQDITCNVVPDLITRVAAPALLQFNVFPVPASDRVTIACRLLKGQATLQLLDAAGRTVRTMAWPIGAEQMVLDLSGIRNGSYFISIDDTGTRRTQPLIVLR